MGNWGDEDEAIERDPNASFWMLYVEGMAAPTHKHTTLEAAKAEAERLMQQPRAGRVYILKAEQVFERTAPPVVVRELT